MASAHFNSNEIPCANKIFPDFSVSLNLAYKDQVGRHVIASRDIRSGEILAVEDPAISFLSLDERGATKFGSACTHCFMRNLDCLPSPLTNCVRNNIKNSNEYKINHLSNVIIFCITTFSS